MHPDSEKTHVKYEPEFTGSGWKNPYVLYIALTLLLFGFLVFMGYLAWTNGWIPNRGTSA
jgi:hypothetical protein